MSLISDLLPQANILGNFDAVDRDALFEAAARLFELDRHIPRKKVFDSLTEREKLGSTGLGNGIAIPHGRIKGLKDACGALYRLSTPLDFDAPDNQPVSLCFILLVPKDANERHLQILGELAQLFGDEVMRTSMLAAPSRDDLLAMLNAWSS